MASPAGCSGYRCESPPCTEPCPTSVVPVHRPHLSTAWLPSVHPPGRPGRRGRSARGAAASGLTERSDCRHHASHVATLCHRLVRRRLNTLFPPDLPKSLPQLLTGTLSSKDPRSHPSSPIPPSTPPSTSLVALRACRRKRRRPDRICCLAAPTGVGAAEYNLWWQFAA